MIIWITHPNLTKLKIIATSLEQLQVLECESCQLEQHARSSFPKQTKKRCNLVFSTIHLDILVLSHLLALDILQPLLMNSPLYLHLFNERQI